MANEYDSIRLGGQYLRPAPYVSTNFEYSKAGEFNIGGFLIVNLTGTIVSKDVFSIIKQLNDLMINQDCIDITIGCSGGTDFLDGTGRIRSVVADQSDQPFLGTYTIVVAVETISGKPAVSADPNFISQFGLNANDAQFLMDYNEVVTINGDGAVLGSNADFGNFGTIKVSKAFVKATGRITVGAFSKAVCGFPNFKGLDVCKRILDSRASQLLNLKVPGNSTLFAYDNWYKWLDSKGIEVDDINSTITWNFELYMTPKIFNSTPKAWVDININATKDTKTGIGKFTASGTIKGLSTTTKASLDNKATQNERIINARAMAAELETYLINGNWNNDYIMQTNDTIGTCTSPPKTPVGVTCYQRQSSRVIINPVDGEITFTSEFGDISVCMANGVGSIDVNIEHTVGSSTFKMVNKNLALTPDDVPIIREITVPGRLLTAIQSITPDSINRVSITITGTLKGCDTTKVNDLIKCVIEEYKRRVAPYLGWISTSYRESRSLYGFSIKADFVQCDIIQGFY